MNNDLTNLGQIKRGGGGGGESKFARSLTRNNEGVGFGVEGGIWTTPPPPQAPPLWIYTWLLTNQSQLKHWPHETTTLNVYIRTLCMPHLPLQVSELVCLSSHLYNKQTDIQHNHTHTYNILEKATKLGFQLRR